MLHTYLPSIKINLGGCYTDFLDPKLLYAAADELPLAAATKVDNNYSNTICAIRILDLERTSYLLVFTYFSLSQTQNPLSMH